MTNWVDGSDETAESGTMTGDEKPVDGIVTVGGVTSKVTTVVGMVMARLDGTLTGELTMTHEVYD
jgi:hypothetical protein